MKHAKIIIALMFVITFCGSVMMSCQTGNVALTNKSGVQLWGENCIRCHNIPSPATFSDAQWDVAVAHMRVRASLTQTEAEKIAAFLKSAN